MRARVRGVAPALVAVVLGCSGEGRVGVEGAVTYDGKPIDVGSITFLPADGKGVKAGGAITDGRYKIDPQFGPHPGPHRVEIQWLKPTGKKTKNEFGEVFEQRTEGLPDKYHKGSTLTAEIKSGANVIDFPLEK
jgi:hypothetical protein